MTNVLITGGDGFVGGYLPEALKSSLPSGCTVVKALRSPTSDRRDEVFLDLLDSESVFAAVAAVCPDIVIHLAAQSSVAGSASASEMTHAVNYGGTVTLAKAIAYAAPSATVLFASSAEVYGATFNREIATEGSATEPLSPYAQSKLAAEKALRELLPATSRLIIGRPGNHSGAGQSTTFVIPSFAYQIAQIEVGRCEKISVGRLDSRRDFLDVSDVVSGYILLLSAASSLPMRSVFNIASGDSISIGQVLDELRSMARAFVKVELDQTRMRPSEVPTVRIAADPLRALGWTPKVSLHQTLSAVLDAERRRCLEAAT